MPTMLDIGKDMETKSGELAALFAKHKTADGRYDMPVEVVEEVNRRNDELGEIGKQYESLKAVENAAKANEERQKWLSEVDPNDRPRFGNGRDNADSRTARQAVKSLGQFVTESDGYKASPKAWMLDYDGVTFRDLPVNHEQAAAKALFETSTGWAPFIPRQDRVILSAQRRPMVADLIPQDNITAPSVKYMEETTFTNNADTVLEGGQKPESGLGFTERTAPVEKIATHIPVTEEQLNDVPQARSIIDNRLRFMLELAEEAQLLTGDGTSPNLQGFLTKTGIQTQAKGADPTPDAIYKAFTKVRYTGFAEPSGVILHPNDWQDIRLLRTVDGIYIWGSPADAGPERVWGKPVVVTTAITEGTGLTGDFQMFSQIYRREGVRIRVSDSHGTDFTANVLRILVEERLVLVIYRASAFATITGI
jgi:HK97 family phage major capsid protein